MAVNKRGTAFPERRPLYRRFPIALALCAKDNGYNNMGLVLMIHFY